MARFATHNTDDACDIVQDAMLRLSNRYGLRPEDEWPGLFFRILERRIIDWHRRARVRRAIFGSSPSNPPRAVDDLDSFADPAAVSPENEVAGAETLRRLDAAIALLPLRQQQVFLLRELQGFDVRQTAEIMQCSVGRVKTHFSRARIALRNQLEDIVD